ncbi:MAG: universal stress protein [Rhodobacteraceae bacterium]|jgi:nucleotide-binding universal stress UspA family protein|nr:universal stress protein [Paracoccaceae bacterium]
MYKSILVGVDIGHKDLAKALIAKARALRDAGGAVRLVYVLEDIPAYIAAEIPRETLDTRRRDALADLRALAAAMDGDLEAEVRSGAAAAGILDAADEHKADLIMLASHRPDLRDYFIGSTASRVVRHAQCSVLVAR